MQKLLLLTVSLTITVSSFAQCGMLEIPLGQKIANSQVVFEGSVISSSSFWNADHSHIFTANVVEVYKVFKGTISSGPVEILTEGGQVNDRLEVVSPSLLLRKTDVGVFFANPSSVTNSASGIAENLKFEPTVNAQSLIKYDKVNKVAAAPFAKYNSIEGELYHAITNLTGQNYRTIKSYEAPKPEFTNKNPGALAPTITSFSPTTITSGTLSVLTITGTNLGTNTGSAAVGFFDADNGGSSYSTFTNAIESNFVVSWTATQIQVIVPTRCGTGTIQVTDNAGNVATSSATLTVTYGQLTTIESSDNKEVQLELADNNGKGGYTFTYNTGFFSNGPAVTAFQTALTTWRCATYANFNIASGKTTTIACPADDGTNIVSFDNSNCLLTTGLLGKTYSWYSACSTTGPFYWILAGMDILFSSDAGGSGDSWNFGPAATTGGKTYDFQSTTLHELGHAMGACHLIDPPKLMHWDRSAATDVRTLDQVMDIPNIKNMISRSINSYPCGATAHVAISPSSCSILGINESVENNPDIKIYPNPFGNSATLHIDPALLQSSVAITLTLFNILGSVVKISPMIHQEDYLISREGLSNGVYFYQLKDSEKVLATGKLILTD